MIEKLSVRKRISPGLVFLAWVFLLILPLLLFLHVFDRHLEFIRQRNQSARRQFLFNELHAFVDDLKTQNWVQRKFNRIVEKDFELESDSERMRQKFEEVMGCRLAVFLLSENFSNRVDAIVNEKIADFFNKPPKALLKRLFKNLHQGDDSAAMKLLRTFFGNIAEVPLINGRVVKSLSGKLGDTGPVYYGFADLGSYSFLLAIKEQDIAPEMVARAAIDAANGDFVRKVSNSNERLEFPDRFVDKNLSRYIENENEFSLSFILPAENLVHASQRGTISPDHTMEVLQNLPKISVAIPITRLEGRLGGYRKPVHLFAVIFTLLVSIIMLRAALFGFPTRFSVAQKVFLSLGLVGFFPVLMFLFAFNSYAEYELISQKNQALRLLSQKMSALQKQFYSGINQTEVACVKLAIDLENRLQKQRREHLQSAVAAEVVQAAFIQHFNEAGEKMASDRLEQRYRLETHEQQGFDVFVFQILEVLKMSPYLQFKTYSFTRIFNEVGLNRTSIDGILKTAGKLQTFMKLSRKFWFTCFLLYSDYSGRFLPDTIFFPGFSIKALMQRQFALTREQMPLQIRSAGFLLDMGLAFRDVDQIRIEPENISSALRPNSIAAKVRMAAALKRELVWESNEGIEMVRYDETLPVVSYGRVKIADVQEFFSIEEQLKVALYLIILALLVYLVAEKFFAGPVKNIAEGMLAVADGNLKYRFSEGSADEIAELSVSLNAMLKGLEEKEILAQYVSEDVRIAVSDESASTFAPGGESVAASILFCEAPDFSEFCGHSSADEVVVYLNKFVEISAGIAAKNGGVIDKIIENAVMIVFRKNDDNDNHVKRAAATATDLCAQLRGRNSFFPFRVKCGIAAGKVISGKIGSAMGKLDFTVIGDVVNLAARLKALAVKDEKAEILISENAAECLKNAFLTHDFGRLPIKGKKEAQRVFALVSHHEVDSDAK